MDPGKRKGEEKALVPFRPTGAAEEDGVALFGLLHHRVGDRNAVFIDAAAAAEVVRDVEFDVSMFCDDVEDFQGFLDDFRPDVVAGEDENLARLSHGGGSKLGKAVSVRAQTQHIGSCADR